MSMLADDVGWRFAKRSGSDVEHDPTEGDQFNSEDVNLREALVREATQNSQDARDGSPDPVRVRIAHTTGSELDVSLLTTLTASLPARLEASGISYKPPSQHSVLVVEDFNTKGLSGDWQDDADAGPFRSFWFRHGRSFKHGASGGRWGLGKLVFPMSSTLRCHFGLTVRDEHEGGLLLGQAVLKTHTLGGTKHAPHGHWGRIRNGEVEPVLDPDFLHHFADGFGLERGSRPGLSIVVPDPYHVPDKANLLEYVVKNYAFPVLTGRLVFDVLGERVDAGSLRELGRELLEPGLIDFIDAVQAEGASVVELPKPKLENGSFRIAESDFDPSVLERLRRRFADRHLVSLHVPLELTRRGGSAATSFAEIHLKAVEPEQKGVALCVRGEITVPGAARKFHNEAHFALLAAKHQVVSEFLGDAENPAHTDWSPTAERFQNRWENYAPHRLRFIKGAVGAVHRLLATGGAQKDASALLDFFWTDDPAAGKGGRAKSKPNPRGAIVVKTNPELQPIERVLNISKVKGGFTLTPAAGFAKRALPARLGLKVAYDLARGDPFKEWRNFDFDLGTGDEVELEVEGAKHLAKGCRIELRIDRPDFRLSASGFDPERDLVLKWGWLKEVADA